MPLIKNLKLKVESMKIAVFSAKSYDRQFLEFANRDYGHELVFFHLI
jgi:hypothetical protein